MSFRIAFDLDGVLADLGAALAREAEALFGPAREASVSPEPGRGADGVDANGPVDDEVGSRLQAMRLAGRQQRQLWSTVRDTENFWETLEEIEPGSVAALAALAEKRCWEVIFLTKRPPSAGATCQIQSQRWLQRHGFALPSVFVVSGSRGKVAAALALDVVVDDRPENCLDVVVESGAKAILVWRGDAVTPASARRLGIGVVGSMAECLDILARVDDRTNRPGMIDRFKRLLGLSGQVAV